MTYKFWGHVKTTILEVFQGTLPATLLCYDLLTFFVREVTGDLYLEG